ncbi:MAG: TetR/AcrR family transcriptional regulator [Caulobacteraceae bacterium]|nr:TetR/AcrR family transcriptional regulator [Caulobacteraceae bacterium]
MKDRAASIGTKERLLRAGEQLFRTRGYAGASLKQLTQAAGAPWGSAYHFFPDGKEQLGVEVVRQAGDFYGDGWRESFDRADGPGDAIERVFRAEARILEASDYRNGCPVASVTLDTASTSEALRSACASAFEVWLRAIEGGLRKAGASDGEATALAGFVLSAIEGAIVLSRAAKSPAPLLQSAAFVREVVDRRAEDWRAARANPVQTESSERG